ncbi:hypothetical protein D3C80_994580 [compost metagenome]
MRTCSMATSLPANQRRLGKYCSRALFSNVPREGCSSSSSMRFFRTSVVKSGMLCAGWMCQLGIWFSGASKNQ